MKKRLLTTLVIMAMLATILTACSSKTPTAESADGTNKSSTEAVTGDKKETAKNEETKKEKDDEIYEVVMTIPIYSTEPAGLVDVEAAINDITVPEIGVEVSLYPLTLSDLVSQTNMMLQSGEKLDLITVLFSGVGGYVSKEALLPLDDLMEEYGADIQKAESIALAGGYYNNLLYAIPSEEKHARSYGYYARTDVLEELGMEFDSDKVYDLEDLEPLFAAYKEKYGDGHYCVAGTYASSDLYSYMYEVDNLGARTSTGVLVDGGLSDDTTIVNLYDTPEYEAYAKKMYDWAQAGYFATDASTNTDASTVQIQSGFYLGVFNDTETDMPANISRDCGQPMTAITLCEPYASTSMYMVSMWSIPESCENPEKTFQFLNMLYGDNELANILTNGLEGVTYEVVEQGKRPGQMSIRYADGVDAASAPYIMPLHVFGDKLNVAVFEPMTIEYYEMAEKLNNSIDKSRQSISLGYVFNSDSVAAQRAAVEAVVQQYVGIIGAGAQDPATVLPQFREALNAAGIKEIIAENQAQFDKWLAAQ